MYKVSHTSHTCLRKDSNPIPPIDELLMCNNHRFFDWLQDNQKLFVNENSSSQSSLELTSSSRQPKFPRLGLLLAADAVQNFRWKYEDPLRLGGKVSRPEGRLRGRDP